MHGRQDRPGRLHRLGTALAAIAVALPTLTAATDATGPATRGGPHHQIGGRVLVADLQVGHENASPNLVLGSPLAAGPATVGGFGGFGGPGVGWPGWEVAPGLTVASGVVGGAKDSDAWTVTVRFPASDGASPGHLGPREAAEATAERVRAAGFTPRVESVDWPRPTDAPRGVLGHRVRVGRFAARADADAEAARLRAAGFSPVADWTPADGTPGTGLARVHVAVVDPARFRGELAGSYGTALGSRETTSAMARDGGALLAVNAGYFVVDEGLGITGTLTGTSAYGGRLLNGASNGRAALVLPRDGLRPRIAELRTDLTVRSADATREVDGLNRKPGIIRNCGGIGGDSPTERPLHDVTCTDPGEIVLLTPELGVNAPTGEGTQVVLDASGKVTGTGPRGGPVHKGTRVLQGIGDGATWLRDHAPHGARLTIGRQVTDVTDGPPSPRARETRPHPTDGPTTPVRGRPLALDGSTDVLNGGPLLVRDGEVRVNVVEDGIAHPDDPSFLYTWGMRRNPRQLVGTDASGRILLVTADGRQPGFSDGLGLVEAARLMRALGAREAMALDGGGSTTMVVDGKVVNSPSDTTGERPVGDALLVLPPPTPTPTPN